MALHVFLPGLGLPEKAMGWLLLRFRIGNRALNFLYMYMYVQCYSPVCIVSYCCIACCDFAELSKAMLLTEFGNNRPEDILKTKLEVMHSLAVEPGQVVG